MVATGRVPNTKTLGLENMGIETNRGFVQVRDASLFYFMCTSDVFHYRKTLDSYCGYCDHIYFTSYTCDLTSYEHQPYVNGACAYSG